MVLLGKIMAQIIAILGLSTKAMKEGRISQSIHAQCFLLIDRTSEKFAKKLVGRTDLEDAFLRIDLLTKDENMTVAARTLRFAFDINSNIEGLQPMDERVVSLIEGTQCFLSDFVHTPTSPLLLHNRYRPPSTLVTP